LLFEWLLILFDAAKLQLFFHTTKFFRKKIAFYPIFLAFCKMGLYEMAHFRPFFFVISKKSSTFAAVFFFIMFFNVIDY
jgi:hypothetical protein